MTCKSLVIGTTDCMEVFLEFPRCDGRIGTCGNVPWIGGWYSVINIILWSQI